MKRFFKILRRIMILLISIIGLLIVVILLYMQQPKFGKAPSGERLEKIKRSPNYKSNKFQNKHVTPTLTQGYSMMGLLYDQLFKPKPNLKPISQIPSFKTNLKALDQNENAVVWFGHSSYFIQLNGIRFLVDPVFSGTASPVPGSVKAFSGTDAFAVEDIPKIDYLIISHDHYDHLDYETIKKLKVKVDTVICGLGVGSHFEYWGYPSNKLIEKDWNESVALKNGMTIHTTTARHFSGRSFNRNITLWISLVLEAPNYKMFLSGDSGYDTHFKEIGDQYGPFDLVILEDGQYNVAWEEIHMLPPQVLKAARDLKAKRLFPVHNSKFALAMHPWNEPLNEVSRINEKEYHLPLVTPIIGEVIQLDNPSQTFKEWWRDIK